MSSKERERKNKISIIKNVQKGMPIDIAIKFSRCYWDGDVFPYMITRDSNGQWKDGDKKMTLAELKELKRFADKYGIKLIEVCCVADMTREQIDGLDEIVKKEMSYEDE